MPAFVILDMACESSEHKSFFLMRKQPKHFSAIYDVPLALDFLFLALKYEKQRIPPLSHHASHIILLVHQQLIGSHSKYPEYTVSFYLQDPPQWPIETHTAFNLSFFIFFFI